VKHRFYRSQMMFCFAYPTVTLPKAMESSDRDPDNLKHVLDDCPCPANDRLAV